LKIRTASPVDKPGRDRSPARGWPAAPSIYPRFADRDAILDAVIGSSFEQLRKAASGAGKSTGETALLRAINHQWRSTRYIRESPGRVR
jgi:hypothetical protein